MVVVGLGIIFNRKGLFYLFTGGWLVIEEVRVGWVLLGCVFVLRFTELIMRVNIVKVYLSF